MFNASVPGVILLSLSVASLSACDWVDSAGIQGADTQLEKETTEPETQFETSAQPLEPDTAVGFLEDTVNKVHLSGTDGATRDWTWELIEEGDTERCESISGFDAQFAASTLNSACTQESQCAIEFEETVVGENTEFNIDLPSLMAPVALTYRLSAFTEEGVSVERQQFLCAISVNEAPVAGDDTYRAVAGETRVVEAEDSDSLLSNDQDDIDVRNQPLQVDTLAVKAPQFANVFTLGDDGGFTYEPISDAPFTDDGELVDSFVYSVSDGLHSASATATIRIVAENTAPTLTQSIPELQINLDADAMDVIIHSIDLSDFLNDVDNDPLTYTLMQDELSDGLSAEVDDEGMLSVSVDTDIYSDQSSEFLLGISVSDGLAAVETDLTLQIIQSTREDNTAPTVGDISNRSVTGAFAYDVSVFFNDPDGDELTFTSDDLPPHVQLSSSGVITGISTAQSQGNWIIEITATDPFGASVSDGFRLIIE